MAADTREIRVERATDPQRYHASDKLIWFDSPGTEPLESVRQLGQMTRDIFARNAEHASFRLFCFTAS